MWQIKLRGGAYNGFSGHTLDDPQPVVIAWACCPTCEGHATWDPSEPAIVLRTAETYTLAELDTEKRVAVYEVGESSPGPGVEERELVGAGDGVLVSSIAEFIEIFGPRR
jgi:hypothetical protein